MVLITVLDILKACGLSENAPNIKADLGSATIVDGKINYTVRIKGNVLSVVATRELTKNPSYKLLSDINNDINIGVHKIIGRTYCFELLTLIEGVTKDWPDLPVLASYVKRQALQGFEILNTSSDRKRETLLAAHRENREA